MGRPSTVIISAVCFFLSICVSIPLLADDPADGPYAPQRMEPNPVERTLDLGRPIGMERYPSQPIPGQPGADRAAGRNPWGYPQWQPYIGSVEHYRVWNQKYINPIPHYNHRTLLANFPAQQMDGVTPDMREQYTEPVEFVVRGGPSVYTGERRDPVPVVRLKPGGERLRFELDTLPTGMYAVRLIAAIEPENVEDFGHHPKDMIVDMTINDGPRGETRHYALRQRGTDNFYSMGEFFFHVEDARPWEITLGVHANSNMDLLVHNVDVHDMLAETAKRAGKTRSIHISPETLAANWDSEEAQQTRDAHERAMDINTSWRILGRIKQQYPQLNDQEIYELWRETRDDAIWLSLPPKNFNFYKLRGGPDLPSTPDPATAEALEEEGRLPRDSSGWFQPFNPDRPQAGEFWTVDQGNPWRMVWYRGEDDIVEYTADDLFALKPLPGFPFEVPPWGKSFELEDGKRSLFFPITQGYNTAFRHAKDQVARQSDRWVNFGIEDEAHDAAMYLARLAYDLPSYTESHAINDQFAHRGAYFSRVTSAHHFRRWSYQYIEWERLAEAYDKLFPYIQGNQRLADSIGRHVKWVETPEDVITLLDTYLLQYGAREAMYFRYYYNHQHSRILANFAAMQTDPEIAEPWIKGMFEWTWEYPHPYGSVEDFMYLGTQRDGTQTIGSFSYALGGSAVGSAAPLVDEYIADGGDPRYNLSDLNLYPRVGQFPFWLMESRVAGLHPLHIGDVGGPTTAYAQWFDGGSEQMNLGWRWTNDPRFAWAVVNYGRRRIESDEEWAALLEAAATVDRDPFMSNRSRVLADWGAILEGNIDSDDFQRRQAARIRIGVGAGHAHSDTLDLGLWSHGLTMAGDMGGRGGYGRPATTDSMTHNLVTINKSNWMGHAWTRELADLDGLQYMNVDTMRGGHYSRQVALIERPRPYFVDFARTIGGREHSYNFHGHTEDLFETNIELGDLTEADAEWLGPWFRIEGEQWAGDIDADVLQATWRMAREPVEFELHDRGKRRTRAPEASILGRAYDEASPRKYLRVHLPGLEGLRVRSGVAVSAPYGDGRTDGDWLRRMHVIREADGGQASSLFAAVWEPYEGESFIAQVRMEGYAADASSYAAIHVQTAGGNRDIIFSDAVDIQPRTLEGDVLVDGSFAYISREEAGLRQVSLVGGRLLQLPELRIETESPIHEAQVTDLDYIGNIATIDRKFPGVLAGRFFEVGRDNQGPSGARWSNFEIVSIDGDRLVWRKGADGGTGLIEEIVPGVELVGGEDQTWQRRGATEDHALLRLRMDTGMTGGRNQQVAIQKGHHDPSAIADVYGRNILLKAADAEALGLEINDRVRLFEIAVGDTFRTNTQVSLTRLDDLYRVTADVPCVIEVNVERASWSLDGDEWRELPASERQGFRILRVTDEMIERGGLLIRIN